MAKENYIHVYKKQTKERKKKNGKKKIGEKDIFYKFKIQAVQIFQIVALYLIVVVSIILFAQGLNFLSQYRGTMKIPLPLC